MYVRFLAAVAVMMFLTPVAPAQPAPQTEAAPTSRLTGTSFGATPDRDLRPQVISNSSDYLTQLATQADPASQVSDVEVIFWRNAVKPQAVEAYRKLVTDNLSQGGYTYTVTGTQSTAGQTTTLFTAESNQQGRIIGFWQATPQGLFLNWGRSSGGAATAPAPPPPAQAAEQPGGPATMAPALAPTNIPLRPLDQSALVVKAADGTPIVANKNGSGIDGIKLSQHDVAIVSPSMTVAPDGTIHVAFVEQHRTTYANAIYHRSSTDGGKTWTEAKNLSEDMPNIDVGRCQVLVDARNRVYVIWRSGMGQYDRVSGNPSGDARSNLWFRELEGGKWTRIKPIGETVTSETQWNSAFSYFAALDAAGRVHVLWNVSPDKWHPELTVNHVHSNGIGNGLVFQSILDGASAGTPREAFLPVMIPPSPGQEYFGPSCDSLDAMNGYVDAAGEAHFVTTFTTPKETAVLHLHFELIENGNAGQKTDFPELSFHGCKDIPTLLVDAEGRRHVIALYLAGEHPNIRDYLLGSDDEPTVIRAAVGLNGIIDGFQAYQGPGGQMVVIMQMNDTGERFAGDNFVSISTGDGKWSVPVNVTNNAGRKTFHNTETSAQSNVAVATSCLPGPGAVAFDRDGHLLLIMVKGEYKMVLATAFGVNTAGGDTITPTLRFLKF